MVLISFQQMHKAKSNIYSEFGFAHLILTTSGLNGLENWFLKTLHELIKEVIKEPEIAWVEQWNGKKGQGAGRRESTVFWYSHSLAVLQHEELPLSHSQEKNRWMEFQKRQLQCALIPSSSIAFIQTWSFCTFCCVFWAKGHLYSCLSLIHLSISL